MIKMQRFGYQKVNNFIVVNIWLKMVESSGNFEQKKMYY